MANIYGVVETTKVSGRNYSFQATEAMENGGLVTKGALVAGENEVYVANKPATATLAAEPAYLIANPAWTYDDNTSVSKNEENYINPANLAFRVYELNRNDRFKVSDNMVDPIDSSTAVAEGQYVGLQNGSVKLKASAAAPTGSAFVGKIIGVEDVGFAYAVGQAGEIGYTVKKVLIEVVANAASAVAGS